MHTKSATDGLEPHPALHWKALDFSHKTLIKLKYTAISAKGKSLTPPLNTIPHTWSGKVFDLNCS